MEPPPRSAPGRPLRSVDPAAPGLVLRRPCGQQASFPCPPTTSLSCLPRKWRPRPAVRGTARRPRPRPRAGSGDRPVPHGDVVVHGLRLQQGEVDVDAVPRGHRDQPHAVLQDGVLFGEAGGVNGSVLRRHVVSTRGCEGSRGDMVDLEAPRPAPSLTRKHCEIVRRKRAIAVIPPKSQNPGRMLLLSHLLPSHVHRAPGTPAAESPPPVVDTHAPSAGALCAQSISLRGAQARNRVESRNKFTSGTFFVFQVRSLKPI